MGNISSKKCVKCNLKMGDYGIDYMVYVYGKGKYSGLTFCMNCLYEKISTEKKIKESNNLVVDYTNFHGNNIVNKDDNKFKELR